MQREAAELHARPGTGRDDVINQPVTAPGVPPTYDGPAKLVTDDLNQALSRGRVRGSGQTSGGNGRAHKYGTNPMSKELVTILSSAGVSTAISGLLIWLVKSWIEVRLKGSIDLEYGAKLESAKREIGDDYDRKFKAYETQLGRMEQDRVRKIERLMKHYERQIEEFYGPLWNMVHQLYVCNDIKNRLQKGLDQRQGEIVEDYYQNRYFSVIHTQIRRILRTRLYLVDGPTMPESFYRYLRHAIQERDQRELFRASGVNTGFVKGEPWPDGFHEDIKRGFDDAMTRYEKCLEGLRGEIERSA